MKRAGIIFVLALTAVPPLRGQDSYPKVEIFAGYSFSHASIDSAGRNLNGWGASLSVNAAKHFGVTAELSDVHGPEPYVPLCETYLPPACPMQTDRLTLIHLLGGPRFSFRARRAAAFAHVLLGAVSVRNERAGNWPTQFAMGFGGGVDVPLGRHFAYRLLQADYIPAKYSASSAWYYAFRLQTGIVFRLGSK